MKYTRNLINCLLVLVAFLLLLGAVPAGGDEIFVPEFLWKRGISGKGAPVDIADTHLRIPYRDDGVLDEKGYFTTFSRPDVLFDTPGLNCSGLVLSISRFLFGKNFTLVEATRDRQVNSGPGSELGKDWDFGLDLILNISDGVPRRVVMPDGRDLPLETADGRVLRGFDLDDHVAWQRVLSQMQPGRVYLGSISKATAKRGYRLLHYHVVIMIPDEKGHVWLYHSTHRSNVHRMDLKSRQGLNRLMTQFRNSRRDSKKILVVEARLGETEKPTAAARDTAPPAENEKTAAAPAGQDQIAAQALRVLNGIETSPGEPQKAARSQPGVTGDAPRLEDRTLETPKQPEQKPASDLVINHLSGKVFNSFPELVTHIPRFVDDSAREMKLWFRNRGETPRNIDLLVRGPDGDRHYKGTLPADGADLSVIYPRDFGFSVDGEVPQGRYGIDVRVDDNQWLVDVFEVAERRDAVPHILSVRVPSTVRSGATFTVGVRVINEGAESDYGGITVSTPNPDGLRLLSAKPGRIYSRGSTVLSVTSDKMRTEVPMAERWIELWEEKKVYDMQVKVRAGKPGTYPIYVRCTLRSVNVKNNVVLMDPPTSDARDQQGFPVQVFPVTVQ